MTAPNRPTVSIGVPVYNGENFLDEMMQSLLSQTFTDFEVVVSDNGSTDRTPDILADFERDDPRVKVHRAHENQGAGWNFNRVLELSQGRYFKWQAHDDLVAPTYLERCVEILERDPGVCLAHTGVDLVDESLGLIEHYGIRLNTDHADPVIRFSELTLRWNLCLEVFGLIRMSALRRTNGMGNYSHGDGVLLAHLALLGRFALIDEPLFFSRQHSQQSMQQFGFDGGGNDYHAYAVWFDPKRRDTTTFPAWRIMAEYQRTVFQTSRLTARQRARCEAVIVRRARLDARHLIGDLTYALRAFRVGGASSSAAETT
jgi:glycosyltransferase involved in cell wall biosynthesis